MGGTDWWMTQEQLAQLSALVADMTTLHKRHLELMKKRRNKAATVDELQESASVIAKLNKLFDEKRALEKQNPLLWENLEKSIQTKE